MWHCPYSTSNTISNAKHMSVLRAINTARKSLMTKYLGFQHISRDDYIKDHTRPLVQEVLSDGGMLRLLFLMELTLI